MKPKHILKGDKVVEGSGLGNKGPGQWGFHVCMDPQMLGHEVAWLRKQ